MLRNLSPEERRKYNAAAAKRSRAKLAAKREALHIPEYQDYKMPETQRERLAAHAKEIKSKIQAEVGTDLFAYNGGVEKGRANENPCVVDLVACMLFGVENGIIQKVEAPSGVLWGGYFPESVSTVIEHVHRDARLLNSKTFKELYGKFIRVVNRHFPNEDCKAEIAGTYVLPVRVEPKAKPAKPEPPQPAPKPKPELPLPPVAPPTPNAATFTWDASLSFEARRYIEGRSRR